jgi:two-component system chemotaxis response regulator CheB
MTTVLKISRSRPLQAQAVFYSSGEVLHAEFRGEVILSVFDPGGAALQSASPRGGLVVFGSSRIEEEFKRLIETLRLSEGAAFERLQFKAIVNKEDSEKVRAAALSSGIHLGACAAFGATELQEIFFYSNSGRMRVAPLSVTPVVEAKLTDIREKKADKKLDRKIRVLIVDDSKTMRHMLRHILSSDPRLEVVGEADLPSKVEKLIQDTSPDVMTLDINMPEMSGVDLLRLILPKKFIPTVMISALSVHDGEEILTALELGAVDYIQKPQSSEIATVIPIIIEKIIEAAHVQLRNSSKTVGVGSSKPRTMSHLDSSANQVSQHSQSSPANVSYGSFGQTRLLAIGASTGGTEAIKKVFTMFPNNIPPIAVVQHIPPYFSMAFANRLNDLCSFSVREAKDGDEFLPGLVLVAPGGLHMEVKSRGGRLFAHVYDADPVNRFKPSVDVLFASVAKELGSQATGVLMTGMGADGAKGLLQMKKAGAFTIAQDEESCVVFGMPRAAIELGAASVVKPLEEIAETLITLKKAI